MTESGSEEQPPGAWPDRPAVRSAGPVPAGAAAATAAGRERDAAVLGAAAGPAGPRLGRPGAGRRAAAALPLHADPGRPVHPDSTAHHPNTLLQREAPPARTLDACCGRQAEAASPHRAGLRHFPPGSLGELALRSRQAEVNQPAPSMACARCSTNPCRWQLSLVFHLQESSVGILGHAKSLPDEQAMLARPSSPRRGKHLLCNRLFHCSPCRQ